MKTKRRKWWLTGTFDVGVKLTLSKKEALAFNPDRQPTQIIERLPGDVVLSREQSAALKALAEWEGNSEEPVAWEYGLKPNPNCRKCGGKGVYTWQDGHNGDDHESDCDCTRAVALTVGQALAPFRGRR